MKINRLGKMELKHIILILESGFPYTSLMQQQQL